MYVRLAFAVAAHLEPEILLVDEVLAVGDLSFQRKCLGQMEEIAGTGRTVLFVSHNMNAVRGLCTRVRADRRRPSGGRRPYRGRGPQLHRRADDRIRPRGCDLARPLGSDDELLITGLRVLDPGGQVRRTVPQQGRAQRRDRRRRVLRANGGIPGGIRPLAVRTGWPFGRGTRMATRSGWPRTPVGPRPLRCTIPAGVLNEGSYGVIPGPTSIAATGS